jgi:long-chain acyl-CoA synthetase
VAHADVSGSVLLDRSQERQLLEHNWEPGGVELTPTMKLKRRGISERYAAQIEALYAPA